MSHKRRRIANFIIIIAVIVVCGGVIAFSFSVRQRAEEEIANSNEPTGDENPNIIVPILPDPSSPDPEVKFIDLQPTLDSWVNQIVRSPSSVGVMIYDLNNDRIAAQHNANQVFDVASVYKLLFVYDGYRQIALGQEDGDSHFVKTAAKGDLTLSQCLDLVIRESYNGCADILAHDKTRVARVYDLMRENEMDSTSNIGLESTAADLTKLLQTYWQHTDLTDPLWEQLADSMLVQPTFTNPDGQFTDLRQGLPAGFSANVDVYNKVGWAWNPEEKRWDIYADAAIADFTNLQHSYIIVVLTRNISSSSLITKLGTMIEDAVVAQSEEAGN